MAQDITEGMLSFVMIGAAAALLWFNIRKGKRDGKNKKKKRESTVI
jgi:hypothetical protein